MIGIVSGREGLVAGAPYRATIGGLRNPRNLISDLKFGITTYGPSGFDVLQKPEDHIIDLTVGGRVDIDKVSRLETFSALAKETTNGATSEYVFSWFTDIETQKGDQLHIVLPDEVTVPYRIREGLDDFKCEGKTSLEPDGITCEYHKVKEKDGIYVDCTETETCTKEEEKDAVVINIIELAKIQVGLGEK